MAEKTKKPKPKKKNDKPQSERFKEIARKLEVDESGKTFNEAFTKILPSRPRPSEEPTSGA